MALLLIALGVEFAALRRPPTLTLPAQARIDTRNPKIGVHTRLTGVGDEAHIRDTLALVREMHASWITELFPWAYMQPRSRYGYDWNGSDAVIQHASRQGLRIIARIDIVPEWARPRDSTDRYLDEEHYVDYADMLVAFLQRYRPYGVRHVVVWNEPNLAFEWGQRPPDPGGYAALLKVVYPRVKAAVPDAVVLVAGLSPGPDLGGGAQRMSDIQYLASVYDAQAAPFFDGVAVHTYGGLEPPEAEPSEAAVNFRRVEVIHQLMQKFGDGAKPVYITEGGWNDSPRWSGAVHPVERARYTVQAYELAQRWPWLEAMCLWQFGLPQPSRTYQDGWTFVTPDLVPRAVYDAVQRDAAP